MSPQSIHRKAVIVFLTIAASLICAFASLGLEAQNPYGGGEEIYYHNWDPSSDQKTITVDPNRYGWVYIQGNTEWTGQGPDHWELFTEENVNPMFADEGVTGSGNGDYRKVRIIKHGTLRALFTRRTGRTIVPRFKFAPIIPTATLDSHASSIDMDVSPAMQMKVTCTDPSSANSEAPYSVSWISTATDIAEIDPLTGLVTAHRPGTFQVIATVVGTGRYSSIALTSNPITVNSTMQLEVFPKATLVWRSGDLVRLSAYSPNNLGASNDSFRWHFDGDYGSTTLDSITGIVTVGAKADSVSAMKFSIKYSGDRYYPPSTFYHTVNFTTIDQVTTDYVLYDGQGLVGTYLFAGSDTEWLYRAPTFPDFDSRSVLGDPVTYIALNPDIATVVDSFRIRTIHGSSGVAHFDAYTAARGKIASFQVTVRKNDPIYTIVPNSGHFAVDGNLIFRILDNGVQLNSSVANIDWQGCNDQVIRLHTQNGAAITADIIAKGICNVTAFVGATRFTTAARVETNMFYVDTGKPATIAVADIGPVPYSPNLLLPIDASYTSDVAPYYASKDSGIYVSGNSIVVLRAGVYTVDAYLDTSSVYDAAHTTFTVTVTPAEQNMVFFPVGEVTYAAGKRIPLTAYVEGVPSAQIAFATSASADVATIDDSVIVLGTQYAGTIEVTATAAADTHYLGASKSQVFNVTIGQGSDDIVYAANGANKPFVYNPATQSYEFPAFDPLPTTSVLGKRVTYTVSNEAIATVNPATGDVTFLKAGSVLVTGITSDGIARNFVLTLSKVLPALRIDHDLPLVVGRQTVFTVYDHDSPYLSNVTWASSPSGKVRILTRGGEAVVTPLSNPSVYMIAHVPATAYTLPDVIYSGAYAIDKAAQVVTPQADMTLAYAQGLSVPLFASTTGDGAITFTSAHDSAVVVGNMLYVFAADTYVITATAAETDAYTSADTFFTVTVTPAAQNLVFLPVGEVTYAAGKRIPLAAYVEGVQGAEISFTSTTPGVTFDDSMLILPPTYAAQIEVTAIAAADSRYLGATKSQVFNVIVGQDSDDIVYAASGANKAYIYSGAGANWLYSLPSFDALPTTSVLGKPVTYTVSNEAIATVDPATGDVTFIKAGTVQFTGRTADGIERNFHLTLSKAIPMLAIDPSVADVSLGDKVAFTLLDNGGEFAPGFNVPVIWTANESACVSIVSNHERADYTFVNVGSGSLDIIAYAPETEFTLAGSASSSRAYISPAHTSLTVQDVRLPYVPGLQIPLSATTTGDGAITFSSAHDSAVVVGNTLCILQAGVYTMTATAAATANYIATSVDFTVTIDSAVQNLVFSPVTVNYEKGRRIPLSAYVINNPGAKIEYATDVPATVATLVDTTLTLGSVYAAQIPVTATAKADANYKAASITTLVTVDTVSQLLAFQPIGDQIFVAGKQISLQAVSNVPGAEITFALTPMLDAKYAAISGKTLTLGTDYLAAFTVTATATLNGTVFATDAQVVNVWGGESYELEGSGTEADPYLISWRGHLETIATAVNGGEAYTGKYFKVVRDFSMSVNGRNPSFKPIGYAANFQSSHPQQASTSVPFSGILLGAGHTISDLVITAEAEEVCAALFGALQNATIRDLTITNANITGRKRVAILAGHVLSSTFDNCHVVGTVTEQTLTTNAATDRGARCGGMVAYFTGIARNCSAVADVTAPLFPANLSGDESRGRAGGLIGAISTEAATTVENCRASANVECYVAGILIGYVYGNNPAFPIAIRNCYATGTASTPVAGIGSGNFHDAYTGGLIGSLGSERETPITVSDCRAENGTVSGVGHAGGFIGNIWNAYVNVIAVTNCSASMDVVQPTTDLYMNTVIDAGGFIGGAQNATFTNCYATGSVSGDMDATKSYLQGTGGFAGIISTSTIIDNCSATGTVVGASTVGGFVGKSETATNVIKGCFASGDVMATADNVGGFAGWIVGSVSQCYATGNVAGGNFTGGFAGVIRNGAVGYCYATGNVSGADDVGGFAGFVDGTTNVLFSYAAGRLEGFDEVGGFLGAAYGSAITADGCYYDRYAAGTAVGVAYDESSAADNVFGLNTWEMQTPWFVGELCFIDNVWTRSSFDANGGYPALTWQNAAFVQPALIAANPAVTLGYQKNLIVPLPATTNSGVDIIYVLNDTGAQVLGTSLLVSAPGTYAIDAYSMAAGPFAGDSIRITVTVGKGNPQLVFFPVGEVLYAAGKRVPLAAISSNPNGNIWFTAADSRISVQDSVLVLPTNYPESMVQVTAHIAADTHYLADSVTQVFNLNATGANDILYVDNGKAAPYVFDGDATNWSYAAPTFTALPETSLGGDSVVYSVSNEAIATVDPVSRAVIFHSAGTVQITATAGAVVRFFYLTALKADPVLVIQSSPPYRVNEETSFRATDHDATPRARFTWSASTGTLFSTGNSLATVTPDVSGSLSVSVVMEETEWTKAGFWVTQVNVDRATPRLIVPQPLVQTYEPNLQIPVAVSTNSDGAVTLSCTHDSVVALGSVLFVRQAGTYTITATTAETASYVSVSDTFLLTVGKAMQVVRFSPIGTMVYTDSIIVLQASGFEDPAFTFVSSNPAVASVVDSVLTIHAEGMVEITAVAAETTNYLVGSATQSVQVLQAADQFPMVFTDIVRVYGQQPDTMQLPNVSVAGYPLHYSSSDTNVAFLTAGNVLNFRNAGATTVNVWTVPPSGGVHQALEGKFTVTILKATPVLDTTTLYWYVGGTFRMDSGFGHPENPGFDYHFGDPGYVFQTAPNTFRAVHATQDSDGNHWTVPVMLTASETANYVRTSATVQLSIEPGMQTVAFRNAISPMTYAPGLRIPLQATASSGYPVAFSILGPATAGAYIVDNTLVIVEAGTYTIQALQDGIFDNFNTTFPPNCRDYVEATAGMDIVVGKAAQKIFFPEVIPAVYGDSNTILNAYASSTLPVRYTSSNNGVAEIVNGTEIAIRGVGQTTITAWQDGDTNYLVADRVSQKFDVYKAQPQIVLGGSYMQFNYLDPAKPVPAVFAGAYADTRPLTFTSSDTSVVRVDSMGMATPVNAGIATIMVTFEGDSSYHAANVAYVSAYVSKIHRTVKIVNPATGSTLTSFQRVSLAATVDSEPQDSKIVFYVDRPDRASVNGNELTALGNVTPDDSFAVYAYAEESRNFFRTATDVVYLNTDSVPQEIWYTNLQPDSYRYLDEGFILETVGVKDVHAFTYTVVADTNAMGLPDSVVTITQIPGAGYRIDFTAVGTALIHAHADGDSYYAPYDFYVEMKVDPAISWAKLRFSDPTVLQLTDEALPVFVTVSHPELLTYTVTSDTPEVATVHAGTPDTYLLLHHIGNSIIRVSTDSHPYFIAGGDQINLIVRKGQQWITFPEIPVLTYAVDTEYLPGASCWSRDSVQNYGFFNNGLPVYYTSSNPNVVRVIDSRLVVVGAGDAVITASQSGNAYFESATDVYRRVVVLRGTQEILWPTLDSMMVAHGPAGFEKVLYGDPRQLAAWAHEVNDSGLQLRYTILAPNYDSAYFIDSKNSMVYPFTYDGYLYAKRTGVINVEVYAAQTANYNAATRTFRFFVDSGAQKVDFALSKTHFTYGDAPIYLTTDRNGQPAAVANPGSVHGSYDRPILYVSQHPDSVYVGLDTAGRLVMLPLAYTAGTEIYAVQAGDESFNPDTAMIVVTVDRAGQQVVDFDRDRVAMNHMYTLDSIKLANTRSSGNGALVWTVKTPATATIDSSVTPAVLTVTHVGVVEVEVYAAETDQYLQSAKLTHRFITVGARTVNMPSDAEIYVQQWGLGKGDGSTAADATGILTFALQKANATGAYVEAVTGTLAKTRINDAYDVNEKFVLKDGTSITGGMPVVDSWREVVVQRDSYTTLDGQGIRQVMSVTRELAFSRPSVLERLEFRNGRADNAAALQVVRNMTVANCYFFRNTATNNGGAVNLINGTVINSVFAGNTAALGAGIFASGVNPRVVNSVFYGNQITYGRAGDGSAILNAATAPLYVNLTVIGSFSTVPDNGILGRQSAPVAKTFSELISSSEPVEIHNTVFYGSSTGEIGELVTPKQCAFRTMSDIAVNPTLLSGLVEIGPNDQAAWEANTFAPNFVDTTYEDAGITAFKPDALSVLINRADSDIYAKAVEGLLVASKDSDIFGNERLQRGYIDIGAIESSEKGWLKIFANDQHSGYTAGPLPYVNFTIEPAWNIDSALISTVYYSDGPGSLGTTDTPSVAGNYYVTVVAPTVAPYTDYWHVDTASAWLYAIDSSPRDNVLFTGPFDVEWDNQPHTLGIDTASFYFTSSDANYRLIYTSDTGTWFNGAAYDPYTVTFRGGVQTGATGTTAPVENGIYTVEFVNEDVNYDQTKVLKATLRIRPRVIAADSIFVTGLAHVYDRTPKAVTVAFDPAIVPWPPVEHTDFEIYYIDPLDPMRDTKVHPTGVGTYTVVVDMFGDSACRLLAGHYEGTFTYTMTIRSDDLYAINIPVHFGDVTPDSAFVLNPGETRTFTVPVIAFERTPAAGQEIWVNIAWALSADIADATGDMQRIPAVFNGTDTTVELQVTVTAPQGMTSRRYVIFALDKFGPSGAQGLMLRSVDPDRRIVEATLTASAYAGTGRGTGFAMGSQIIRGLQPSSVGFYMAEAGTVQLKAYCYQKFISSFRCVTPGGTLTTDRTTAKTFFMTFTADSAGYYEFIVNFIDDIPDFNNYRVARLAVSKGVTAAGTKMEVGTDGRFKRHVIQLTSDKPKVDHLQAVFAVDQKDLMRDSVRYIVATGGFYDPELRDIPTDRIDIIDGVRLHDGQTEEASNIRVVSMRLESGDTETVLASGATVKCFSERIFGYYLPTDVAMSDTLIARGYRDSFYVVVREAGAGDVTRLMNVYVGSKHTRNTVMSLPASEIGMPLGAKTPVFKGVYSKYYIPYKPGKTQKPTAVALRRRLNATDSSVYDLWVTAKIELRNRKLMKSAMKSAAVYDILMADSRVQQLQRNRLGVEVTAYAKVPGLKGKVARPVGVMVMVPPTVDTVMTGVITKFIPRDHQDYKPLYPMVLVEGGFFSGKPVVYAQYKSNGKLKTVRGTVMKDLAAKSQVLLDNGGQVGIPKIVPGAGSRVMVRFPKKVMDELKRGGSCDIVVESRYGVGAYRHSDSSGIFKNAE